VAASQGEATDAGGGEDPGRGGQPVPVRRGVEGPPGGTPLHPGGARGGIDVDPVHRGQVDHQPAVDGAEPRAVVSAAADGDRQPGSPADVERGLRIGNGCAAGDERRASVDHGVVDRPDLVVGRVVRRDDRPAHPVPQLRRLDGGHVLLLRASTSCSMASVERAKANPDTSPRPQFRHDEEGPPMPSAPSNADRQIGHARRMRPVLQEASGRVGLEASPSVDQRTYPAGHGARTCRLLRKGMGRR
jgi:hypothetical protein